MMSLFGILNVALDILWFIVIAHVIMSWLITQQQRGRLYVTLG